MGQKINPISLRLQTLNRFFDSCWYTNHYYSDLFQQDLKIQNYLQSILKQVKFPTGRLFIQSSQKKINVFNFLCNPLKGRRIRSYYFRRKYHKISKKSYLEKNRISKLLLNIKDSQKSVRSSLKNSVLKQRNKTKQKKVNLNNILYKKYFNTFYTSQDKNQITFLKTKWMTFLSKKEDISTKLIENSSIYNGQQDSFNKARPAPFPNKVFEYKSSVHKSPIDLIQKKVIRNKIENNILNLRRFYETSKRIKKLNGKLTTSRSSQVNFPFKETLLKVSNNNKDYLSLVNIPFNYIQNNSETYSLLKEKKLDFYKNGRQIPYRKHIETVLELALSSNVNIETIKTYDHFRSASFLAEEIVYYLEQRIPFRRIKSKLLKEIEHLTSIKGIRITCSGRVGGRSKKAQRAKTDLVKYGETSLHVFSSRIDFSSKKALTSFGLIGIKVWICYTT